MNHIDKHCAIYDLRTWAAWAMFQNFICSTKLIFKPLKVDVCIIGTGSEPLFCLQDQRLGGWRSWCDDTFKGNGEPVERDVSCWSAFIFMIILTTVIHWRTRVSLRGYFPGRQRLVWYHILREDKTQLNIKSCRLNVFQDIYWGKRSISAYTGEYVGSTNRRPNPNTAESGSLTSELSFPSFIYRSGWNAMGSLNTSGSCIIDLNKKFRTENRI